MKLSVIIPIYNVEKYVEACLESALNQTMQKRDYEILCIDDCGRDNSMSIVAKYANENQNVRIVTHDRNKGLSAARNTGIESSKGEYIFFLDSDDTILPETLEELYYLATTNQADIVYYNMKLIIEPGFKSNENLDTDIKYSDFPGVYSGKEMFVNFMKEKKLKVEACRRFYNRQFLINHGLKFYEGIVHEDNLFSYISDMNAERVVDVNKEYYNYYKHGESIMSNYNSHRAQSVFVVYMEILRYWHEHCKEYSEEANLATEAYLKELRWSFFNMPETCRIGALELSSQSDAYIYEIMTGAKQKWVKIADEDLPVLRKAKLLFVFGAGAASGEVIRELKEQKMAINGVVVSDVSRAPEEFCGMKPQCIDELLELKDIVTIIVAVTSKYREEINSELKERGFKNLINTEDCKKGYEYDKTDYKHVVKEVYK